MKSRIFNEIWKRLVTKYKKFTIPIFIIACLTMSIMLGLIFNASYLKQRVNALYTESNIADVWATYGGIDENDINYLTNLNSADKVERRMYFTAVDNDYKSIDVFVKTNPTISVPKVVDGAVGIMMNEAYAKAYNYKIGENFIMKIVNKAMLSQMMMGSYDEMVVSCKITGFMNFAEKASKNGGTCALFFTEQAFLDSISVPISAKIGFTPSLISKFAGKADFMNQYLYQTDHIDTLLGELKSYNSNVSLIVAQTKESTIDLVLLDTEALQARVLAVIFIPLLFIVQMLIYISFFLQLLHYERKEIGKLEALGLSHKDIEAGYKSYVLRLLSVSSIVGGTIGTAIVAVLLGLKATAAFYLPLGNFPYIVILYFALAIAIYFIFYLILTKYIVRKKINFMPAELMKTDEETSNNAKNTKFILRRSELSFRIAFRSLFAKKGRTSLIVFGIAFCGALMIAAFGLNASLQKSLAIESNGTFAYDIKTGYSTSEQFAETVENLSDVESQMYKQYPLVDITGEKGTKSGFFTVFEYKEKSPFINFEFGLGDVAISRRFASNLGVKVGDNISVTIATIQYNFVVTKIIDTCMTNGVFINTVNKDFGGSPLSYMYINTSANQSDAIAALNKVNEGGSATSSNDALSGFETTYKLIDILVIVLEIITILLLMVVLISYTRLNLRENNIDIRRYKLLGLSTRQTRQPFIREAVIQVVLGSVLALAIGPLLLLGILALNNVKMLELTYTISWWPFAVVLTLITLTWLIVEWMSMAYIKKQRISISY